MTHDFLEQYIECNYYMRHSVLLFFLIFFLSSSMAQMQEGYVKTIGRPGKPGVAVPQATIRVQGVPNAVLSDQEGHFQLVMTNKKNGDELVILSVQKNGFELRDRESSGRRKVFSTHVPIYILMVDSKQLAADKQRIERKAYHVAEENYKKKMASLESQLNDKTLSAERYRQELKNLQHQYESYMALVGDMADRYARTDYDQLDSIDREINLCIENGELEKADSLIHTIFDPETVLERNRAAKEEIRQRMAFAQSVIDKAQADKATLLRDREYASRVVMLCGNLAEEHLMQGQVDEAIRCLEQALDIQQTLYGDDSPEAIEVKQKINTLRQ